MPHIFTSLRHATEKLLEAEYFLCRSMEADGIYFQYELNAFLSASRNVTFIMQSSMSRVAGFGDWYAEKQAIMRNDPAMRFFLELRNVSQKQGPVSYVSGAIIGGGYTYRFVEDRTKLPRDVIGKDIRVACAEHLVKLGSLLSDFYTDMPFDACPWRAFSEAGMKALHFEWSDVEVAVGYPSGWANVDIPAEEKFKHLRRDIEPLNVSAIERIASNNITGEKGPIDFSNVIGTGLIDRFADNMSRNGLSLNPRAAFLRAVIDRVKDIDGK
ncbi:hypothetical protein [Pararhodobacter sp. CCB-MM2]|uniref:hypothetical protein n=1 Tax=Pararhodobacter sp. CCB-MM2 TaxID=1786003 RepID=UPI001314C62F|nr:hypothetical protein [Pararhodobacter sp. CCB-MM2]